VVNKWGKVGNNMFCGINAVNLDAKGRMAIPAKYRLRLQEEANNQLVVTIDTEDNCLLLYPVVAWKAIEQKIELLPSFNQVTRRIQRLLIGHATEVELDNNGRILLPLLLRDYAGLDKKVILVGQGKKFEIWAEDKWNTSRNNWLAQGLAKGEQLPEQLLDLSL
jgi:MraZ protein